MKQLIGNKLLYAGLVPLDSRELVDRYNECLRIAGIEPTRLKRINIDGAGWSPEVAEEKGNTFYLCHDVANPMAIIVSQAQFKKPVYFPTYSWMRRMLRSVFDGNFREIADITATHGLVIDFDNQLASFESPADLLLLNSIVPKIDAGELSKAAIEQQKLIDAFFEGTNCLNSEVQEKIREHARIHGDLRRRRVVIERMSDFGAFQDFYTTAFGGAAVLRGADGNDVLILEDEALYSETSVPDGTILFFLYEKDYGLLRFLWDAGWISIPDRYKETPDLLIRKKEVLLAHSLLDLEKNIDWDNLTSTQRKQLVGKHKKNIPEMYFELERFIAMALAKKTLPELSDELSFFLAEPASHLHPATQDVLWILLTRCEPRNILELYTHDKNFFLNCYKKFGKAKREWVAGYLAANYTPLMLQP